MIEMATRHQYKKTQLPVTRGYFFALVFSYLPGGIEVFTGTMDHICKHLHSYPLHHGMVLSSRCGTTQFSRFGLFGQHSYPDKPYIDLIRYTSLLHYLNLDRHMGSQSEIEYYKYQYGSIPINKHHKYYIVKTDETFKRKFVLSLRRLPRHYIKEFKNII